MPTKSELEAENAALQARVAELEAPPDDIDAPTVKATGLRVTNSSRSALALTIEGELVEFRADFATPVSPDMAAAALKAYPAFFAKDADSKAPLRLVRWV